MKNDWILDVLADLTAFANANRLSGLADQLGRTAEVAMTEIQSDKVGVAVSHGNDSAAGSYIGEAGERQRA